MFYCSLFRLWQAGESKEEQRMAKDSRGEQTRAKASGGEQRTAKILSIHDLQFHVGVSVVSCDPRHPECLLASCGIVCWDLSALLLVPCGFLVGRQGRSRNAINVSACCLSNSMPSRCLRDFPPTNKGE